MQKELTSIFKKTMEVHFPQELNITKEEYLRNFIGLLHKEICEAPELDEKKGNLATYLKLSVLVLSMAKNYMIYGLAEAEIGEYIYKTADAHFKVSPLKKWIQAKLFFSKFNLKKIIARQNATSKSENGINGFRIEFVKGRTKGEFGVDYLQCGICEYFKRKEMFSYVKYCSLVDYAIMKNLGISFSRTMTLGNNGTKCDFRFSKSGGVTVGWPPCALEEFSN